MLLHMELVEFLIQKVEKSCGSLLNRTYGVMDKQPSSSGSHNM